MESVAGTTAVAVGSVFLVRNAPPPSRPCIVRPSDRLLSLPSLGHEPIIYDTNYDSESFQYPPPIDDTPIDDTPIDDIGLFHGNCGDHRPAGEDKVGDNEGG
jgi:hypothetical protein